MEYRKKKEKRKNNINWISTIRRKVQEGELNAATRILKEDEKGVETPTDELLQRMTAMFPRRKNREALPEANPTATRLTHFKPQDLLRGIMRLQGSGGPSHLDAKSLKRVMSKKHIPYTSGKNTKCDSFHYKRNFSESYHSRRC